MPNIKAAPRQIFLGNISYDATPDDVLRALHRAEIGAARVRIATHRETGAPRGFGFLDIGDREKRSVQDLIECINLYQIEVCGRVLRADVAKDRPQRQDGPARAAGAPRERARPARQGQRRPPREGGRGHAKTEFQRGRHEFDGPWTDD